MEILKIFAYALLLIFVCELLQEYLPGYSFLLTAAGTAAVLTVLCSWVLPLSQWLGELAALSRQDHFSLLLKAALIAFLSENVGEICADAGHTALRSAVELAGRCLILLEALPLFSTLTESLITLLQG